MPTFTSIVSTVGDLLGRRLTGTNTATLTDSVTDVTLEDKIRQIDLRGGSYLRATSGPNSGLVRKISTTQADKGIITVSQAFPSAFANGNTFEVYIGVDPADLKARINEALPRLYRVIEEELDLSTLDEETSEFVVSGRDSIGGEVAPLNITALIGHITISVANTAKVKVGDILKIEDEKLLVTTVSSSLIGVTRGYQGTSAAEHASGTMVYRVPLIIEERDLVEVFWEYGTAPYTRRQLMWWKIQPTSGELVLRVYPIHTTGKLVFKIMRRYPPLVNDTDETDCELNLVAAGAVVKYWDWLQKPFVNSGRLKSADEVPMAEREHAKALQAFALEANIHLPTIVRRRQLAAPFIIP